MHVDVKKVGRIPNSGGWRTRGRGSEQAKRVDRSKKRGTSPALHSIVDGFSRLAYIEALPDETGFTAVILINWAKAFFAAHCIVRFRGGHSRRLLQFIRHRPPANRLHAGVTNGMASDS